MLSVISALLVLGPKPNLTVVRSASGNVVQFGSVPVRTTASAVSKLRSYQAGDDEVVAWTETTKGANHDHYAIIRNNRLLKETEASYILRLRYSNFNPTQTQPVTRAELDTPVGNEDYIVQFGTQPLESYRRSLESAGAQITYYLNDQSFIVRMNEEAKAKVENLEFVRWVGPYKPAYKLDESLRAQYEAGTLPKQRYNIQTYEYGIREKQELAQLIELLGGTPADVTEWGYTMQADLTPVQLIEVLKSNNVFWVDKHSDYEADMDIVRQIGGANYIQTIGNYQGQGVRGQVRDIGCRTTHVDFASRPLLVRSNTSDGTHGTSTTGIVFGDGAGNPQAKGMLPLGQGIFIAGLPNNSTRYAETAALLQAPYFGVFESNSTGSSQVTTYTTDSFGMDDILFRQNILICQSQSNLGTQQSRPQAWAKNIVSIGGIKHMNTLTTADDNWTGGGSIGPAADGRIKPDLSHFYDSVFTDYSSSDTAYTQFSGTSAATPITSGHFGLLFQMWADGVFGQTVTGSTVFDARPHWSTMKALMINTANSYSFSGTSADLTRTHQGWGLASLQNAYDQRTQLFIRDYQVIHNLETQSYRLYVPAGKPFLKATMVYKDLPGTTSSTIHRINDLTLKVTDPTGAVFYYGNNGLLAGNWSTPGGSPNTVDTVENVFVQNPTAGVWTVDVIGSQVNQDAHLETTDIDADYALVVNGVASAVLPDSLTASPGSLRAGGLSDLYTSNNSYVNMQTRIVATGSEGTWPTMTVTGTSPVSTASAIEFRLESRENLAGTVRLAFFNFSTNTFEDVGTAATSGTDRVISITPSGSLTRFIDASTRQMKVRVQFDMPSANGQGPKPNVSVDQVRWIVTP